MALDDLVDISSGFVTSLKQRVLESEQQSGT